MAILEIKSAEACQYDLVSLGEIMLRLDPGEGVAAEGDRRGGHRERCCRAGRATEPGRVRGVCGRFPSLRGALG